MSKFEFDPLVYCKKNNVKVIVLKNIKSDGFKMSVGQHGSEKFIDIVTPTVIQTPVEKMRVAIVFGVEYIRVKGDGTNWSQMFDDKLFTSDFTNYYEQTAIDCAVAVMMPEGEVNKFLNSPRHDIKSAVQYFGASEKFIERRVRQLGLFDKI